MKCVVIIQLRETFAKKEVFSPSFLGGFFISKISAVLTQSEHMIVPI